MVRLDSELSTDEFDWDLTVDVVVVGSGAAGWSAALSAASGGLAVTVVEAADHPGGTTAKSGGTTWIPGNHMMREAGLPDDRSAAVRYLARLAYPDRYSGSSAGLGLDPLQLELIETFCDNSTRAVDFLMLIGALTYRDRLRPDGTAFPPYPDYQALLPENGGFVGRSMSPGVPDGCVLPDDFLSEGGLLPGGMIMIETMRQVGERLGVSLLLGHRVVDAVEDVAGRVVGVVVRTRRDTRLIRARHGVVFGSGGFLMNRALADEYLRGRVAGGCSAETNRGDFVGVAARLGAGMGNMSQAWWTQTVLEMSLNVPSALEAVWYPFGDSMIQVNKYGRRAVNEKQVYNERGQIHFVWDAQRLEYPNQLMFQVYDRFVAENPLVWPYRGLTPMPGENTRYVIEAQTLEELVRRIDERLESMAADVGGLRLDPTFGDELSRTITRFNRFAGTGVDEDFGRGEEPIQRLANGPGRADAPNPTMAPISSTGPYYCIIMAAGAIDTKGGPRIDARGRVLDVEGSPIDGLFGAGNCVSSPFGQAYPGAGGSIAAALTFGYLAGRTLVEEARAQVGT